ncbi:hypothetical protein [Spirochaeta cellobiosiphila]|uniref:hypothetical protein n=1 Tax=Spirochaeta cellobiosiphila TaxID=504483 RepID=UPI0004030234|nr:hypothetical protein [Spirochaeta cellobiosiphila]
MKSLAMYTVKTSAYELFTYLCDLIISGKVENFKQIENHIATLPHDKRRTFAAQKAFAILKSHSWGFFKELDPVHYPRMWQMLVIPSKEYPGTGMLKRNMTITSLFCGLIDIHGYTSFCQKAGKNISLLKLLDEVIQHDISKIAQTNDVITQRARGDEIILIGSRAGSVLKTVLDIADYFQKKKVINPKSLSEARMGQRLVLPKLAISAGVTGGQKYTPLIITADGDVSGHLLNSAARLQTRANKQAPHTTNILLSSHVHMALKKEIEAGHKPEWSSDIFFWNAGQVSFKGTRVWVYEMVLSEEGQYKRKLKESIDELLLSLKKEQWEGKIFISLLSLISRTVRAQGPFNYTDPRSGLKFKYTDLIYKCEEAMLLFMSRKQFILAIEQLQEIAEIMDSIETFDGTVREYTREILPKYLMLGQHFRASLEEILEDKIEFILPVRVREIYKKTEKAYKTYKHIREDAFNNPELGNKQALWNKGISLHTQELELEIYSGKR